ncbi:E3 ubiquitin-protein ligase RNF126 isoform X2 [Orussus abietinus]|uniref:E3 ubiquitin-protein ligase RNF126 isoform X2 n=1 Tax=Orussus abietinus TaxID=222816 RepID=UPI000625C05B|nr:E3 ubiquitin-protein ligase RNF126 isoform X2 [Orussus abietinus]
MAEAVVDGAPMSRFFCHQCSAEIEHLLPDYTCPNCYSGFIEELENSGNDSGSSMDMEADAIMRNDTISFLPRYTFEPDDNRLVTRRGSISLHDYTDARRSGRYPASYRTRRHPQRDRDRQSLMPIDSLIQNFIFNLSRFGLGPLAQGVQPPVLFLGNPGDYVWGRDGLDAIVTQLLNQMDGTGPPPLPQRQIDEIPTTAVSQLQVDMKLQCSVCWEDFQLSEPVRQLPCQHFYHAPCIVPWLELHGTCPICRQSLGDQNSAEANQDTVGPSLAALFRAANESSSSRTSFTSSSSAGNSSSAESANDI